MYEQTLYVPPEWYYVYICHVYVSHADRCLKGRANVSAASGQNIIEAGRLLGTNTWT